MADAILYVDDAPELPAGAADALQRVGYRLVHTADPAAALRFARERSPCVVLVEVALRSGGGMRLIERIRSCEGPAGGVPILILTRSERSPALYGRALELGVGEFLCKPVLSAELLAAVLECTARNTAEGRSEAMPSRDAESTGEFRGELSESPLPELLHRLHRLGATGVLVLEHDAEERAIQLRNGSPIAVAHDRGPESFEDFLVRTKRISGAEHEALVERVEAGLGSTREVLVAMGVFGEAELDAAIGERAAEPLLEAFSWRDGSYGFEPDRRLDPAAALGLDQSPARLLFEGALQWAPSDLIRGQIRGRERFYVSRAERPAFRLEDLGPQACAPETLGGLTGERSVADVLASGELSQRVLYGLLITQFVEIHPDPVLLLRDALAPAPPRAGAPVDPVAAEDRESEPSPLAARGESPNDLAAPGPKPRATEESRASRARDADSWFRKGVDSLRCKRHGEAAEAFGMAAQLDPDVGEYRSHLGYAMHLENPLNELIQREALEHIAKGIKLAPDRARPLVFLGLVFKATGELENARKVFRRALRLEADCERARRELRLLSAPAPKRRSLLDRLLGR